MADVAEIRQGLVESKLMNEEAVDGYYAAWQAQLDDGAEECPDDFVDWLIECSALTQLHGEALLAGYTGPFVLGPYDVHEQIAGGRSGGIYRAQHEEFNQPVSLKVYPRAIGESEELQARLGREMRIATQVGHPNVVKAFQMGRLGDIYYMALEALDGETLAEKLQREGRLPFEDACRIGRGIARGLAHLHENEVIHRDLRPANIWVSESGEPKIMEFGASVDALAYLDEIGDDDDDEIEFTADDMVVNKYDYMPPEQAYNQNCADALSDIYSLGCVFYHCLTGRPPFIDRNPVKKVLRHVYDNPSPPSQLFDDIPKQIDETVADMLAKVYEERFQSAADVAWALDQYVEDREEAEAVVIAEVSDDYLEWVQSQHTEKHKDFSEGTAAASAELSSFLGFMADRNARMKRK